MYSVYGESIPLIGRVIYMSIKICYSEICKNEEKIHLRTMILIGLIVGVGIVAGLIIYYFFIASESWNLPIFPIEL